MTAPAIGRLHALAGRAGRPACGIAGQLLNAATNVATAYVASALLHPDAFGAFVIAFACITIVLAAGRGLLGATMMVHLPTRDTAERRELVRSAVGLTIVAGLGASALLALGGFVHPVLWAFAPWTVVALLQDVGRYAFLAAGDTVRALVLDVVWAVVQSAVLAVAWSAGAMTIGWVAAAWGLGALGGVIAFGVLHDLRPSHPTRWARATRDVAGWFTAVAVVGQIEVYLVLLLTGVLLATVDVGGVRTVQLLAYQPALVLLAALLTVLQPAVVRARESAAALRAVARTIVVAVLPVIGVLAVMALLREPLMTLFFPQYTAYASLVVPIALQSALVALMVAPLAVLNGLRHGRTAFAMQLLRTVVTACAAVLGMHLAGADGLAWSIAAATAVACAQTALAARRVVAGVGAAA